MRTKHLSVLIQIRIKGEVGTVRYAYTLQYIFYWQFKAVLLLWIVLVIFVKLSRSSLSCCPVCTLHSCNHLLGNCLSLVSLVRCDLSLSHMVSRVRCGTWLYQFQIFAFQFTLIIRVDVSVLCGGPKSIPAHSVIVILLSFQSSAIITSAFFISVDFY